MRLILGFFILIAVPAMAQAYAMETKIHDIDMGDNLTEEILVFLTNGKVVSINPQSPDLLYQLDHAKKEQLKVQLILNDKKEIINIIELQTESESLLGHEKNFEEFIPSVLTNMDEAKVIFKESKRNAHKESQCYNRAHVWTYEWRVKRNLYTSKVWIYFTRKFIRKFKPQGFEWWFHVAPLSHVNIDGQVKERVMDIKYQAGPSKIQQWTDYFTRGTHAQCPVIDKYSDYANFPNDNWCFIMKSSMYYYQPVDLEFLERYGTTRSTWSDADIRGAYLEAFKMEVQ